MGERYGTELIVDLADCDRGRFTGRGVRAFCRALADEAGMRCEDYHEWSSRPRDYDVDPPHLHGVSAVQFITTSSIVVHTIAVPRTAYVNLFTCGDVADPDRLARFCAQWFGGRVARSHLIPRGDAA